MLELREIAAFTACRELQRETSVHDRPRLSNRAAIHRAESCSPVTKEERNMRGGGSLQQRLSSVKPSRTSTQAVLLAGPVCPAGPAMQSLILP